MSQEIPSFEARNAFVGSPWCRKTSADRPPSYERDHHGRAEESTHFDTLVRTPLTCSEANRHHRRDPIHCTDGLSAAGLVNFDDYGRFFEKFVWEDLGVGLRGMGSLGDA